LRALLEESGRIRIVCEASDGVALMQLIGEVECDAILLDLAMPGGSGLKFLEELRTRLLRPPVVVLSMHDDAGHVDRALALGASGYVLKSARPTEIVTAVEAAIAGGAYIQPALALPLIERHVVVAVRDPDAGSSVSRRQLELLRALSQGLGNKEIAHRLGIREETVKGYLKDLYARIGVSGRAAAVAWAIRTRLID